MSSNVVELLVCRTCRMVGSDGTETSVDADLRPGAMLAHAVAAQAPEGICVVEVACLSNCSQGCTIALRKPGAWTYVYGNLNAHEDVEIVITGAEKYRDAPDGLVPWRERPEHFRKNCIARIPPLETANV